MCFTTDHIFKKNVYFIKSATYGWIQSNKFVGDFCQSTLFTDSCDFLIPPRPRWGTASLHLEYYRRTLCKTCLYSGKLTRSLTDRQTRKIPDLKRVYILSSGSSEGNFPRFEEVKIYSRNPTADLSYENRIPGRNWRTFAIDIHEADLIQIEYDFKTRLRA